VALFRETNYAGFYHYFGGFGFAEAFRLPEDAEKYQPPTCRRSPSGLWSASARRNTPSPARVPPAPPRHTRVKIEAHPVQQDEGARTRLV